MKNKMMEKVITLGVVAFVVTVQFFVFYPLTVVTMPVLTAIILMYLTFNSIRFVEYVFLTIGIFVMVASVIGFNQTNRLTLLDLLGFNLYHLIGLLIFVSKKQKDDHEQS